MLDLAQVLSREFGCVGVRSTTYVPTYLPSLPTEELYQNSTL